MKLEAKQKAISESIRDAKRTISRTETKIEEMDNNMVNVAATKAEFDEIIEEERQRIDTLTEIGKDIKDLYELRRIINPVVPDLKE